ncbi:uncharacterized protein LOC129608555 [Condylostylus longicornis]|uniref:uncharacterized protein LOC129608555 n=1 Tax=Condylostylus longicornis TaxID=2530218 RepID=UPI00244DAD48|nr:uncharacterized protein LOC129608555 [Condylostylus longicornis]
MQRGKLAKTSGGKIIHKNSKTVLHDIEVPLRVSEQRRSVTKLSGKEPVKNTKPCSSTDDLKPTKNLKKTSKVSKSLHTPQLNTVYNLVDRMGQINLDANSKINLSPNSKIVMTQKTAKLLNFPYDQPVYTDLIPIEDNDDLTPDYTNIMKNRKLIREKYVNSEKKCDPVPKLKDFLSPGKKIEVEFPLYTKQCVIKPPNIDASNIVREIVTDHPSWNISKSTISLT